MPTDTPVNPTQTKSKFQTVNLTKRVNLFLGRTIQWNAGDNLFVQIYICVKLFYNFALSL